jgi:hypothetical protein
MSENFFEKILKSAKKTYQNGMENYDKHLAPQTPELNLGGRESLFNRYKKLKGFKPGELQSFKPKQNPYQNSNPGVLKHEGAQNNIIPFARTEKIPEKQPSFREIQDTLEKASKQYADSENKYLAQNPESVEKIEEIALKFCRSVVSETVRSMRNLDPNFVLDDPNIIYDFSNPSHGASFFTKTTIEKGKSPQEAIGALAIYQFFVANASEGADLFSNTEKAREYIRRTITDNLIVSWLFAYDTDVSEDEKRGGKGKLELLTDKIEYPALKGEVRRIVKEYKHTREPDCLNRLAKILRTPGRLKEN